MGSYSWHSSWVVGEEYRVEAVVGPGVRRLLGELASREGYSSVAVVVDERVPKHLRRGLIESLEEAGLGFAVLEIAGGEQLKTVQAVVEIWRWLLDRGFSRDALLVAYGGGSLSDTAGFAAATYMRGVDWATVPTTLLAMADAAAGGKTGVNLGAKNVVGAFHHPRLIVADTEHLTTLPIEDYVSGLAEVVKHAVLAGRDALSWIQSVEEELLERRSDTVARAIGFSLDVKMKIVARDPRERKGDRMLLNLGHTVAHALERATGYVMRHGHAVSIGLVVEAYASVEKLRAPVEDAETIKAVLEGLGLPTRPPGNLNPMETLKGVWLDKKRRGDRIVLPLIRSIGDPVLVEMSVEEAVRLLARAWERALQA